MRRNNSGFDITLTPTWQISPDMLSVIDLETGHFVNVNPAWTGALGYRPDELEGVAYASFVHPDDTERTQNAWNNLQRGVPVTLFENRYRHRKGTYRWLQWSCVPDETMLYCRTIDVTAAKIRDAEVAKIVRERDNAWRLSQDLLVVISPSGIIESVNQRWTDLLGWAETDLLGRSVYDLIPPSQVIAAQAVNASILLKPLSQPVERQFKHRDGSYRWFGWTARSEGGRIYASGRDLTVERGQADELRQSRKMEAVGQLTGGIAHDFNNLLTGLLGSLELIQMRLSQGRVAEVDRYARAAQGAAQRAASLTQRLLGFARQTQLAPVPSNVNLLIRGMEDMIRRTVGPGIELRVVRSLGLWPAMIDQSQLENAVLNLVINARDAMANGGCITIETANRLLDEQTARAQDMPPGQFLAISVSDTGSGMPASVALRAFEPFYTTKGVGKGTGMGLSMVSDFAKLARGYARIHTEIGLGTTVSLYIPRHYGLAEELQVADDVTQVTRASSGKTVLVVEDEPTVRMLVAEILTDLGYDGIEACDSGTGMRILCSDTKLSLLVADVGIPGGLNGRQMAEAGHEVRPDLPVLLITGYAENAIVGNGALPNWMKLLTKPFTVEMMARSIRESVETD